MRRLAVLCLASAWCAGAAPAAAEHTVSGNAEAGFELDSNVRRVETAGIEDPQRAPMLRLAGRTDVAAELAGGNLSLIAGGHLRTSMSSKIKSEDFTQLNLDAQWTHPWREGALRFGPRLSYRDAFSLAAEANDRTFRSVAAEAVLVLYGDKARVSIGAGPRSFDFKPNSDATWKGAGASARGDFPLWRGGEDDERSLDLTLVATLEQRSYRSTAYTNLCGEDDEIDFECFLPTARHRGDRLHRASAGVFYTGELVASLEAQVTVLDSNSFGRSWTSGRLRGAVTVQLGLLYLTGIGTLQLESYVDRLLVARDPDSAYFDVLEDDNRSSIELRLGVPLGDELALEGRFATWRDFSSDVRYSRVLGGVGVVWTP